MSSQTWTPPNIAPICQESHAPITQCSSTGYLFLALISQLYGGSRDNKQDIVNHWDSQHLKRPITSSSTAPSYFDFVEAPLGSIPFKARELSTKQPIRTSSLFQDDFFSDKFSISPPITTSTKVFSHGPRGSHGLSHQSSYFPTLDLEKFSKNFDSDLDHDQFTLENTFKKREHANPELDNNFGKRRSRYHFSDVEVADSEKVVMMAKPDKKSNAKRRRKRQAVEKYDFIVVGAGSAGCVIANRLSEVKQWKILLIEAGPEEPEVTSVPAFAPVLGRSSIDWNYRTQPEEMTCRAQRGQTCAWLSGRVMGGSSAINYVVYMRGNKKDYDEWAALGNEGWSYEEVLHYFKKSENNQNIEAKDTEHHGVDGPLNVERFAYTDPNVIMLVRAFHEKGLPLVDFNGKSQIGVMTAQTTTKDGKRVSSNDAFIRPIRGRPNLTIKTNCQVIKILINENNYAYGVRYVENGGEYEVKATKEVIISAGALNSPKLLMLSGIGPKFDLERMNIPVKMDLKVGYNLQDHVTTEAVLIGLSNATSTSLSGKMMLNTIQEFAKYKNKYNQITATGPVQITGFIRTKYADDDKSIPDIQFHFDGRNRRDFFRDPATYLATNIFPFSLYDSINVRPILLHPASRGYLTLNKTHPIFGQPLIYPGFFRGENDLNTLIAALKFATKLEKTKAFIKNNVKFIRKKVEPCTAHKWGSTKYFACVLKSYTGTIYHPAGTCKMGPRYDEEAVVDSRLRVHGIHNLRVADASIMPHIVRGNTNAPVMMIGEKVSDMIKEDWVTVYWDK